jgi:hypothetical protein
MKFLFAFLGLSTALLAEPQSFGACEDRDVSLGRRLHLVAAAKAPKSPSPGAEKTPAPASKPEPRRKPSALPRHLFM